MVLTVVDGFKRLLIAVGKTAQMKRLSNLDLTHCSGAFTDGQGKGTGVRALTIVLPASSRQ